MEKGGWVLRQVRDPARTALNLAGKWSQATRNQPQQGRLPATVWPLEDDDLARAAVQGDVLENRLAVEARGDALERPHFIAGC